MLAILIASRDLFRFLPDRKESCGFFSDDYALYLEDQDTIVFAVEAAPADRYKHVVGIFG